MFTHINPDDTHRIHMAELLDRVEDMSANVSSSSPEYFDEDRDFKYYVTMLDEKSKLVVVTPKSVDLKPLAEKYRAIGNQIIKGDKGAMKEIIESGETNL